MMLALTTDKLQLVTSAAVTVDVHVAYIDASDTTLAPSGAGKQNTAISTATTTDILASPASSTVRTVDALFVRNKHASTPTDVTVLFDANGTDYEIHKVTLLAGEMLSFVKGIGWFSYANIRKLDMLRYVSANSVHATAATFADVTDLQFPVVAGINYCFECNFAAITNATTTGAQFGIGGVAMTYMIATGISTLLGSPTASATITTGVVTAINTAIMAQTTGAAVNQPHLFYGSFIPSASGTFSIRATSEVTVSAGLTILKGSYCHLRQSDN
jgi:hypothetical protein